MSSTVYLIDTGALIHMHMHYPIERFPGVWDRMGDLIEERRLYLHRQVYEEIKVRGAGSCYRWKQTLPNHCILEIDGFQGNFVTRMGDEYPYLKDMFTRTENKDKADPWLVAAGAVYSWCVVSHERNKEWGILDLCRKFNVSVTDSFGIMDREDWRFLK